MKKVALLGDSIRLLGYGKRVPALLGDDYTVYQSEDNGRFARYTLRAIWECRAALSGCDVIHWNNGLWDTCDIFGDGPFTPLDEYLSTMTRVADQLLKITPRVIFATTTPVLPAKTDNNNAWIARYNEALVPLLVKRGVRINDLHGLVMPRIEEYITPVDLIHLSDAGIEACAAQVAAEIRAALND